VHGGVAINGDVAATLYLDGLSNGALAPEPASQFHGEYKALVVHVVEIIEPALQGLRTGGTDQALAALITIEKRLANMAAEHQPSFFLGDQFTVLDIVIAPWCCTVRAHGFPSTLEWLDRIERRPAFVRASRPSVAR
jgi:glutathione S-transferase